MLDNQHTLIKGYRDLSQDEIDLMNEIKAKGEEVGALCQKLHDRGLGQRLHDRGLGSIDQRWVGIGKTHLQQGIMALVRAVAQPTTF